MKGKRKFFMGVVVALAAVAACFALTACGSSNSSSSTNDASQQSSQQSDYKLVNQGKLTVGTSPDFKPMEYRDDNGNITGYEYGIMQEVANRLGLELDMEQESFDSLITQVAAGTSMDCAASAITISDEREEQVDFTDPIYDSNLAVVVMGNSDITDPSQITSVAAQQGSSGEDWVNEHLKDARYTSFQEVPDMLAALRSGQVQAAVYDEPVARNHVAGEYSDCKILEVIPTGEQYGIAVNKDNPGLTDAINQALANMQSDGTMDQLKQQYIGSTD